MGIQYGEVRAFSKVGESVFVAVAKSSSDSFAFLKCTWRSRMLSGVQRVLSSQDSVARRTKRTAVNSGIVSAWFRRSSNTVSPSQRRRCQTKGGTDCGGCDRTNEGFSSAELVKVTGHRVNKEWRKDGGCHLSLAGDEAPSKTPSWRGVARVLSCSPTRTAISLQTKE